MLGEFYECFVMDFWDEAESEEVDGGIAVEFKGGIVEFLLWVLPVIFWRVEDIIPEFLLPSIFGVILP